MASVVDKLISCVSASIDDASQRLQLNHDKTTSRRRQHLLPTRTIRVCDLKVSPTRSVRDLTVYINADSRHNNNSQWMLRCSSSDS